MTTPIARHDFANQIRDPRHDPNWSVDELRQVDAICSDFETSWKQGRPLDLQSVLDASPSSATRLLFRELLAIDIEYRASHGPPLSDQQLQEQFPGFRDIVSLVCSEAWSDECDPAPVPAILQKHPRYEITGRLGSGGMGVVWSGRHLVLGRDVAIKVIRSDLLTAPDARERFLLEARTAAKLHHPNIVAVYDAEATEQGQFLVMEVIEGADLQQTVADNGPLPWDAACDAIQQAAMGLQAAQRIGMVHRDLSPRNLMLADDGTVKLLDFGLASLSSAMSSEQYLQRGMLVGSAAFMSPEQIDDPTTCDARSDLYSLGCVLYFLLTGQPPYSEKSLPELLDAHRSSPAPSVHAVLPDVPDNVAAIVNRLLAKQPEARFQSSGELVVAIQAARVQPAPESSRMTTAAVVSPSVLVSPLPPNPHPQRIRRTTVLVVAGVLAIGLCFALWSYSARGGRVPESPDFVQGMSLLDQRQERQVRRAIDKFREVLAHDPRHARAHAALAQAYNLCGDYGWDLPDAAFPKAIESAQRALELNPDLAEGRLALAFASATYKCDWPDAEKEFRLTLKTAPQLAPAHHWYAWFLVQQGRFDEAQHEIERAHELAADNLIIANNVGKILYFSRRYSEAADKHRAALDLDQDFQKAHMDLGYALIELDRADEALSEFDQSVGISSMDWDVQAARAYAMARQRDFDSVKPLLQLLESVADKEGLSLEMAHIYGATGDFDRAFHWLDVAFTRKSPGRAGIAVDPRLDPLRSDPRFAPLLKSIGLKQQ